MSCVLEFLYSNLDCVGFLLLLTILDKAFVHFMNRVWPRRANEFIDIWMMGCVSANSLQQ